MSLICPVPRGLPSSSFTSQPLPSERVDAAEPDSAVAAAALARTTRSDGSFQPTSTKKTAAQVGGYADVEFEIINSRAQPGSGSRPGVLIAAGKVAAATTSLASPDVSTRVQDDPRTV